MRSVSELGRFGWLLAMGVGCAAATPKPAPKPSVAEARAPVAAPPAPVERQPAPPAPAPDHDETVVRFSFETTARAAVPSSTFWVAAHFRMAPGYRISWVNPGDSGRPTRVKFSVPEGFELSDTRFPAPTKFELPDGGKSYGYETETAAFAQVRALPDLDASRTYRFEVEASWLACAERCFPEHTSAFVEFGVDPHAALVPFEPALAKLQAALPQPLTELAGATYRWRRGGRLHVSAAKTEWLGFLPARPEDPKLVEIGVNAKKGELKLRFEDGTPGSRVKGLAIANGRDGVNYVTLDIPWPVQAH